MGKGSMENTFKLLNEGMFAIKISKLQMFTTKFENIRILENHNFSSVYSELSDIVNYAFNLGEPSPNSKVVRKILRSHPKRYK